MTHDWGMTDHSSHMNLPHRKRIGLASLTRLVIGLSRQIASGHKWGTVSVVYQDGQIVNVQFAESWVNDDQVNAAAGEHPELVPLLRAVNE